MKYTIEEIKEILYRAYDIEENIDDERGCYVNGKWLSIKEIIETIGKGC